MVQRTQDTPASLNHSPEHRHTSRLPQRTSQRGPTEATLIYCSTPTTDYYHTLLSDHSVALQKTKQDTLLSAGAHTGTYLLTRLHQRHQLLTQEAYVLFDLGSLTTLPGLSLPVISLTSPPLCASGTRWLLQDPMDLTPAATAPSHHDRT